MFPPNLPYTVLNRRRDWGCFPPLPALVDLSAVVRKRYMKC
jgi:hypothetical protein